MKNTKKLVALILSFALVICVFPTLALADDGSDEDIDIELMAISAPSASIGASGKTATYGGSASFTTTEASIKLVLTLEEKRSGTWYTVPSSSISKTVSNAKSISHSGTKTVTGGYYYRTKAVFTYTSGSKTVYSPEKWVS